MNREDQTATCKGQRQRADWEIEVKLQRK